MRSDDSPNRRRSDRICMEAGVDFYMDLEVDGGRCVDVSQTGICLALPDPLEISIRINVDGEREERTARLIWAKTNSDGSTFYGMEFTDEGLAGGDDE